MAKLERATSPVPNQILESVKGRSFMVSVQGGDFGTLRISLMIQQPTHEELQHYDLLCTSQRKPSRAQRCEQFTTYNRETSSGVPASNLPPG